MYAETGLIMLPYSADFPQFQQFDEIYFPEKLNTPISEVQGNLVQTPTMPDYYFGEGDLFKAPEPIPEEPLMELDPMASAISMMSFGGDVITSQASLAVPDIESSFESGQLLSDVFYECKKDLMAKVGNETPMSEILSIEIPSMKTEEISIADQKLLADAPMHKSVSSSCLRSMDVGPEAVLRPNFIDFSVLDYGAVNGMRRAFSEGDIKNLGNGDNVSITQRTTATVLPTITSNSIFSWEDRKEKLSRYRQKKSRRNFGRKIKYACRKALADSQPRIRGRFAKTEDLVEVSKN